MSPYMQSAFDDFLESFDDDERFTKDEKAQLKAAFAAGVRAGAEYGGTFLPAELE